MKCGQKCSVLVPNVETFTIVISLCSGSVNSKVNRLCFHNITFLVVCLCSQLSMWDCEGRETFAFVMAWRQKRRIRRDSGRMKQLEQTVWWKSQCNDKITQRVI